MILHDEPSTQPRHLALEGAENLRDLGGLPTHDGGMTRSGTVLRSAGLHALGATAQAQLLEYGLTTVIDLRNADEIEREPNPFVHQDAVRYVHVPLFAGLANGETRSANAPLPSLEGLYVGALERCQDEFRAVLEQVAVNTTGVTLFHCTAGKDRTGLIAALLLGAADVTEAAIIEDYALTERQAGALLERLLEEAVRNGMDREGFARLLTARPATMEATLAYLTGRYGGVQGYLSEGLDLEPGLIAALRSRLREPEALG